jgi:hypothetical protein
MQETLSEGFVYYKIKYQTVNTSLVFNIASKELEEHAEE